MSELGMAGRSAIYTKEVLSKLAKSLKSWVKKHVEENEFCLLKKWCFENDFNPADFHRLSLKSEEFRDAYDLAKQWQEYIISYGALKNTLNPRFAQFFLGCNHDWKLRAAEDERVTALGNDFGNFLKYMESKKKVKEEDEEESEEE